MNHKPKFCQIFYVGVTLSLAIFLFTSLFTFAKIAKANDEAGPIFLWLPSAQNGIKEDGDKTPTPVTPKPETPTPATPTPVTPTPVTPTPTTEPGPASWAFFASTEYNTNSASVVTDNEGGIHLAYHFYEAANDGAPRYGVYAYCATDCDTAVNWAGVALGEAVNEIQLVLNGNGQPRVLFRTATEDNGHSYTYAECNQDCTKNENWVGDVVATTRGMSIIEMSDDEQPQRNFALDPQGRPRFVYGDNNSFRDPDHVGTYYAFCNANCAEASQWAEVRINKDNRGNGPYRSEKFYYPVLAFTPSEQPRVLADGTTLQDEFGLHYVECNEACENAANWFSTPIFERGSGNNVAYDIEITTNGQPRIAYYDGARLGGEGEWLYYGWCNQNCTDAANWQRYDFGFKSKEGQEPDLELDAQGKPHIAYATYEYGGLAYSFCTSNCESASGEWVTQAIETRNDLQSKWNVAYPPHCDGGIWDGLTPTLSLDKDGNAIFAYDATYYSRCWYNDVTKVWEPYHQFHLVIRTVRAYFLPKP